ncbi:hypothetical protein QVZ41_10400 [Wenyingzhuangia sp. chi5]|uniref:Uncharacterized protein n=1 Tax=Wenyingzhuangia gilva TaxID=3057677 RepID=A0ABT8VTE5_9FLAO|nr:hypothetical protein [Wenyingzhuangia sp. chi5]MDO3695255.1 hypothetical protein [Wenyingzhuangia sp. chi5]
MSYYNDYFNHTYGANYLLNYNDDGGTGMDGYPNIIVGGVKIGKNWYSGDKSKVGMSVKMKDISSTMSIEWINSESNATDENDKWMASINFIFDNNGTENSIPDSSLRDYDLVIESFSYNFDNSTNDISTSSNGVIYFFARDDNKQIKPYTITYQNKTYTYAVRYKFFNTGGIRTIKFMLNLSLMEKME